MRKPMAVVVALDVFMHDESWRTGQDIPCFETNLGHEYDQITTLS